MTERKIKLKLDSFELRLLINALVEWRTTDGFQTFVSGVCQKC